QTACEKSEDCELVNLSCACLHNMTCAVPDDLDKGIRKVINRRYEKTFAPMAKCTKEETKQCAQAGPCAIRGQWITFCENKQCVAKFRMGR
ncbi:MAG: hypothetical protein ACXWQQ_07990, partial [Pseudobdellovibrio sp.]